MNDSITISIPAERTKKGIEDAAERLVSEIREGGDILETYVVARLAYDTLKAVLDELGYDAAEEAAEQGGKCGDIDLKWVNGWKKYEYNDRELSRLEEQRKEIGREIKERQKFLQSLESVLVDKATGEIVKPAQCVDMTSGQVRVSIPK